MVFITIIARVQKNRPCWIEPWAVKSQRPFQKAPKMKEGDTENSRRLEINECWTEFCRWFKRKRLYSLFAHEKTTEFGKHLRSDSLLDFDSTLFLAGGLFWKISHGRLNFNLRLKIEMSRYLGEGWNWKGWKSSRHLRYFEDVVLFGCGGRSRVSHTAAHSNQAAVDDRRLKLRMSTFSKTS